MTKTNQSKLFVHFHADEHPFVERCLDWIQQTGYNHQVVTTPFLDPREQEILSNLMTQQHQQDLEFAKSGGHPDAERCRVAIGPSYQIQAWEQPLISVLRLYAKTKLKHGQVLGSILALGLKRGQVGDIYPHAQGCDMIVTSELSSFISLHLNRVARETVRISEISPDQLMIEQANSQVKRVTVASLRLDAVLAEGLRLSRADATKLIQAGKCKVDFKITDRPSYLISDGQLLSLRGYGRLCVDQVERKTKKGRYLVRLSLIR